MAKVLLGDVVDRIKDKVDKDATDLEYYVGGEHIDGDEIMVHRKGLIQGSTIGPAFHMRFQRGDVLLMSRNPHLRKASMVDFDGICSDVSYICRTKDNDVLLQSLLPFILQTPEFWQFAEENKKGGLPFFLNWKDFARFEFELQTIERQRQIADLLWAMERVKIAYRELIARTDDLVKSQFIEMIQPLFEVGQTEPMNNLIRSDRPVTYGILKPGTDIPGGIPVVRVKDYPNGVIIEEDMLHTTPEIDAKYTRSHLIAGDLLLSIGGSIGRMAIVPASLEGANITQHTARLSFGNRALPLYVRGVIEMPYMQDLIASLVKGVAQKGLNLSDVKVLPIPVPEMKVQKQLVAICEQSDKSKFAAQQALKEVTDAQKALMKKIFE